MHAKTPAAEVQTFLMRLPSERRQAFEQVLSVVRRHLPRGLEEVLIGNMVVYQVPLARYQTTYNGRALWYVALASEKSYLSLHLMPIYGNAAQAKQLADGFEAAGKKLNMGKACIRFRTADELALDVIADIVSATSVDRWVEIAEAARRPAKGSGNPDALL